MKKLTLLLVAAVMISGGAFAQEKSCCKKGAHCAKSSACCKDKKACTKDAKATTTTSRPTMQQAPKKNS